MKTTEYGIYLPGINTWLVDHQGSVCVFEKLSIAEAQRDALLYQRGEPVDPSHRPEIKAFE